MYKYKIILFLISLNLLTATVFSVTNDDYFMSKKGFAIIVPKAWDILEGNKGIDLFLYDKNNYDFKSNIQVRSFAGKKYIDENTALKYSDNIKNIFAVHDPDINDFVLQSHNIVGLEGNRKGILFYSQYTKNSKLLMQASLLISSSSRHFLITYTDLKSNFEAGNSSDYLDVAWNSMSSFKLESRSIISREKIYFIIVVFLFALIVFFVFVLMKNFSVSTTNKTVQSKSEESFVATNSSNDSDDNIVVLNKIKDKKQLDKIEIKNKAEINFDEFDLVDKQ